MEQKNHSSNNHKYYELAKRLHELELWETLFVKKTEWTSGKSPSEKLKRILKRTQKGFRVRRKEDGSGWTFQRVSDRNISLATINKILEDINSLASHEKEALMSELFQRFPAYHPLQFIETVVCNYYKLFSEEIFSRTRKREIARPRQLIMYFARKHTKLSLNKIGAFCGNKDHATVLHSCKTIEKLIQEDEFMKRDVNNLINLLDRGETKLLIEEV